MSYINNIISNGSYDAFKEVMYYYHYIFNIFYVLLLIIFLNTIKTLKERLYNKKNIDPSKKISGFNLVINILAGIGLANGLFFQGVLSDISIDYSEALTNKMITICIIAFVLFIIQLMAFLSVKRDANN